MVLIALRVDGHFDRIQAAVVLMRPTLTDRLLQLDLLDLVIKALQIRLDHRVEFGGLQCVRAIGTDALQEPGELLAQHIRAGRMAELDLVAIVEAFRLLGERLRAATVRMLAFGEVFQEAGGRLEETWSLSFSSWGGKD